jgi:hypothetical protein
MNSLKELFVDFLIYLGILKKQITYESDFDSDGEEIYYF